VLVFGQDSFWAARPPKKIGWCSVASRNRVHGRYHERKVADFRCRPLSPPSWHCVGAPGRLQGRRRGGNGKRWRKSLFLAGRRLFQHCQCGCDRRRASAFWHAGTATSPRRAGKPERYCRAKRLNGESRTVSEWTRAAPLADCRTPVAQARAITAAIRARLPHGFECP
jgi:hypothetical protein